MIIYWGRKIVRRSVGRVADFCFVCRDFRPFRGTRIESVGHIYSIPLGSRSTLGYTRTCESCSSTFNMQPAVYSGLSSDRGAGLDTLIGATHPRIWQTWYNRLQVERRARDGQLSAEERREFILEPFTLLNYRVEERVSSHGLDLNVGLALLATIASMCYLSTFAGRRSPAPGDLTANLAVGIFVASLFLLIHALATRSRRFTRRTILPIIAQSLRPVSPTAGELDSIVRQLRRMKTPIGKALRIKDVRKAFGMDSSSTFAPEMPT